jgi:hypothetical protein
VAIGSVLWVQVIPSVLVAATALLKATATNVPLPYVTLYQYALAGSVLWVQVTPSVLVAAIVLS